MRSGRVTSRAASIVGQRDRHGAEWHGEAEYPDGAGEGLERRASRRLCSRKQAVVDSGAFVGGDGLADAE